MEPKEKQRIYAQTYVPSVERFDDNPSLIQLASKAKDSKSTDDDNLNKGLSSLMRKSMLDGTLTMALKPSNLSEASDVVKIRPDLNIDHTMLHSGATGLINTEAALTKCDSANSGTKDKRISDSVSPKALHDIKHVSLISPTRKSPFTKAVSPHKDHRQITSISACTWTPGTAILGSGNHIHDQPQVKDNNTSSTQPQTRSDTLSSSSEDKLDLKDVKQSSSASTFFRSFPVQSGRPPMKLERNRGNQKLPVGIAVARQRQRATPSTSTTKTRTSNKSSSPDLDRRFHEHALNQEREVLLRENKELSNYTSRLQTSGPASSIPQMLNLPNLPNPMLSGSWEREQALMASSLLQWQAQQQSSAALLNSSLPHPSMWFGGTSPYHLPGTQSGSSLSANQASASGYPLLGSGIPGGFVIMPQFLQDGNAAAAAAAASMWPSLALYGNSHPAMRNLPHTYQDLLTRQLQNLQHHELQALRQQAMQGIPFSSPKSDALQDEHRQTPSSAQFARKRRSSDSGRTSPTAYRYSASPKHPRREVWQHPDPPHRSPLISPPARPPSFTNKPVVMREETAARPGSAKYRDRSNTAGSDNILMMRRHNNRNETFAPFKSSTQSCVSSNSTNNTQVLDLTASSPEDVPPQSEAQTQVKYEKTDFIEKPTPECSPAFHHISNPVPKNDQKAIPSNLISQPATDVPQHTVANSQIITASENVPICTQHTTITLATDKKVSVQPHHKLHDSRGVELLTKAADIHIKHMSGTTANPHFTKKQRLLDRPITSSTSTVCENGQNKAEKLVPGNDIDINIQEETSSSHKNSDTIIDVTTIDPEILDAVRGITLLSQSYNQKHVSNATDVPDNSNFHSVHNNDQHQHSQAHLSASDYNDDVQSTISFSSFTDSVIFSGDCMSSSELKDNENCEKIRLRRRLKKPISSKLKFTPKEEETIAVTGIKLDSMDGGAKEIDMKMKMADLQRRYKEKQKELAKIQRRNKKEKHDSSHSTSSSSSTATTSSISTAHMNTVLSTHPPYPAPLKFRFAELSSQATQSGQQQQQQLPTPKKSAAIKLPKSTVSMAQTFSSPKRKKSSDSDKDHLKSKSKSAMKQSTNKQEERSIFEKFASEVLDAEKITDDASAGKEDHEIESSDHHQIPSGSRKRKPDKPKRICLPPGETSTVPLVDPSKKTHTSFSSHPEERKPSSSNVDATSSDKKRKRKMKQATKKMKNETEGGDSNMSSWVFKSASKTEKLEKKQKTKSHDSDKTKHNKSHKSQNSNLSNNNNKRKKSRSVSKEQVEVKEEEKPQIELPRPSTPRLELKEEDLVKGLHVLVPLEDKLLYLCQINPIQPPDIYEVTVEGERHRHRPIVMCLEQILKEAVPDVKPKSRQEICEGSRVAAYWSHKMHCLYTGTIAFDDSDNEEEEIEEETVQVEFDDGDSSMIPLEDIRLLPRNYPIMQPDAPFMMHYTNRRRTTSDLSGKDNSKTPQNKSKKSGQSTDKKEKVEEKSRRKSEKLPKHKSSLDLSAYDYPSTDDVDQTLQMPKKRLSTMKTKSKSTSSVKKPNNNKDDNNEETSSSSVSSAEEEDSDTVFSDSSDDTYDGDDHPVSRIKDKRIKYHGSRPSMGNHSNEPWVWHDKDVQKKAVKGKAKKIYHKSINRGDEVISCGDSAVFLSAGRPYLPYIGRIESMWESWGDNMVVKVRWFYHPEETKRGRLKSHGKHPLYKSSHIDENDVQTISHKCEVVSFKEYNRRMRNDEQNVFYCTGIYDPATGQVLQEHSDKRKHQKS